MRVMIGAGRAVHEGVALKVRTYWGERVKAICGAKGNTGGVIRSGCFEVGDKYEVTCKKCLAIMAESKAISHNEAA